jgi:hypothetical protein
MATMLVTIGPLTRHSGFTMTIAGPLLLAAGVGHAAGVSPLTHHLTTLVQSEQVADLSGLILTADWVGTVLGPAALVGLYLTAARHGIDHAYAITTQVIAATMFATAIAAALAARKSARHQLTTGTKCRANP